MTAMLSLLSVLECLLGFVRVQVSETKATFWPVKLVNRGAVQQRAPLLTNLEA